MRQKLVAGAMLEALTPDEAKQLLEDAFGEVTYRTLRTSGSLKTDGSGNGGPVDIDVVPPGWELELGRFLVDADGVTPGAPFNAAAGYIDLLRGTTRVEFVSLATGKGQIPASLTWSGLSAPLFRNGETVAVQIVGGPASVGVEVRIQGRLRKVQSDVQAR